MQKRRWLIRLSLLTASSLLMLGLVDLWLRSQVGACGLTPFCTSPVQDLPYELSPGRTTTYRGVSVRMNSVGMRGAEIEPPIAGEERIALIGDSVVFGNGCAEEGTLSVSLERELATRGRKARVVNAGVPGYNAENATIFLRERVLPLKPTRVIWVMIANDGCVSERRVNIDPETRIDKCADFPLGSPLVQLTSTRLNPILRACGVRFRGYVESVLREFDLAGKVRVATALDEMQRLCRDRGIDFRVAVYPAMVRVDANPLRSIEDEFVRMSEARAIPCAPIIDAFPAGENLGRYWVALLDAHPNGGANRLAARLLADRFFTQ